MSYSKNFKSIPKNKNKNNKKHASKKNPVKQLGSKKKQNGASNFRLQCHLVSAFTVPAGGVR